MQQLWLVVEERALLWFPYPEPYSSENRQLGNWSEWLILFQQPPCDYMGVVISNFLLCHELIVVIGRLSCAVCGNDTTMTGLLPAWHLDQIMLLWKST